MKTNRCLRRGFSLIELSTVVVVTGILASSCAMVLRQAYLVHRNSLQTVAKMRSLDLLRTRWSDDVLAATNAQVGESLELRLTDESRVVYFNEGKRIMRQKKLREEIVARDSWSFAEPVSLKWAIDSSQPVSLISMEISSPESFDHHPPWKFLARLGAASPKRSLAGERDE